MDDAAALRSLASLLRAGFTMERSLVEWARRPGSDSALRSLQMVAQRVSLGAPPSEAFAGDEFGAMTPLLQSVLAVHAALGGDAARSIEALADRVEVANESSAGAAAQAAGAKLSARMVAALPLVFLAFVPGTKLPLDDPIAMTSLLTGAGLVAVGTAWIKKLLPAPQPLDAAATIGLVLASVIRGGPGPDQVLTAIAEQDGSEDLRCAAGRVGLGLTWDEALQLAEDEGLRALGAALAESGTSGAPVAGRLGAFVSERERAARLSFEAETRRAPVRMVVPLTVCMLPAFLLLGAGPLLRGLSG